MDSFDKRVTLKFIVSISISDNDASFPSKIYFSIHQVLHLHASQQVLKVKISRDKLRSISEHFIKRQSNAFSIFAITLQLWYLGQRNLDRNGYGKKDMRYNKV